MQIRYVTKTKFRQQDNLFTLSDGYSVQISKAMKALEVWQACFGYHHTLQSVQERSDWNIDVLTLLLAGKNPKTGKSVHVKGPTSKAMVGVAVVHIMDTEPDLYGEVLDPAGVEFASVVTVSRHNPQSLQHFFGNAEIFFEDNSVKARFEVPFAEIPSFDLYAVPVGRAIEIDEQNPKLIKRAHFDHIDISTERNSDSRIEPIRWSK